MSRKKRKQREPAVAADPQSARFEYVIVVGFLLLAFLMGCTVMVDTDIWWHLRTGQLIWERGEIPQTDWFTYTNPHSEWIDLHWGFQLIAAGLWALGGAAALILAKSAAGMLTYLLMVCTARRDWPPWQTVACLLPSLLLFAGRYYVRPEMASLLLLAATLCVLFHVRRQPRLVWLLPAIQLVWVNVHALFVLGLIVWACFLVDAAARAVLDRYVPDSEQGATPWRRWLAASGAMVLAVFCNPYGLRGVLFPLVLNERISGSDETRAFYKQFAGEFQSIPDFIAQYGGGAMLTTFSPLMIVLLTVLAVVSFGLLARRGWFSLYRLLLFAAFGYLVWQASRNSVLFAVVAGVVVRLNFGDYLALSAPRAVLKMNPGRMATTALTGLLLVAVPMQLFSLLHRAPTSYRNYRWFGFAQLAHWYPHAGVEFLRDNGMPQRVFAMHLGHASPYLYQFGPDRKVFADPRLEVNTRQTLQSFLNVIPLLLDPATYDEAEQVLRGPGGPLPALLFEPASLEPYYERMLNHPRWRLVFVDDKEVFADGKSAPATCAVFLHHSDADRLGLQKPDHRIFDRNISDIRQRRGR